jgi:uncharacterized phage protein gp47/JayE
MTSYPLPTLAAQVTSTGISAPSYADIYASLQASVQAIYGSDIYIDPDSQDGQFLGIFAQAVNDSNNTAIAVYNSFSPLTAQGTGLSTVVGINGLTRLTASNSTVTVTIVGVAGTIITNGIVADTLGNQYTLPASVTIPVGGSIGITATAAVAGAVNSAIGTVTQIVTPTLGWQTVTNAAASTPGAAVETDAALRVRQAISTSLPSQTVMAAIVAAVANVSGVEAVQGYVNDTGSTNALGIPAHSISLVVEGGNVQLIGNAIALKKSPGTGTYGTTSVLTIDSAGIPDTINFYQPTLVNIDANVTIKAQTGYVSTTGTLMQTQLAAYLNSLPIGGTDFYVFFSKLWAPLDDTGSVANTYNITSLTFRRGTSSFATADVAIAFNELPYAGTITITVT